MAFAQLTYQESLRDIEACQRSPAAKLYHMGSRSVVAGNTRGIASASSASPAAPDTAPGLCDYPLPTPRGVLYIGRAVAGAARRHGGSVRCEARWPGAARCDAAKSVAPGCAADQGSPSQVSR
jgi:hypothetical protein